MNDAKKILINVLKNHNDADKWNGALFEHIRRVPNTKVGEVGQDFIEYLCKSLGVVCEFPLDKKGKRKKQNPWDIKIGNVEFELKTATEDVSGSFQFNHIRYHRPYEGVMCLGISPHEIYFNIWSKAQITTGKAGTLVSMEKGANASYKLTKKQAELKTIDVFNAELKKFLKTYKK